MIQKRFHEGRIEVFERKRAREHWSSVAICGFLFFSFIRLSDAGNFADNSQLITRLINSSAFRMFFELSMSFNELLEITLEDDETLPVNSMKNR